MSGTNIVIFLPLPVILLILFVALLVVGIRVTSRMLSDPVEADE